MRRPQARRGIEAVGASSVRWRRGAGCPLMRSGSRWYLRPHTRTRARELQMTSSLARRALLAACFIAAGSLSGCRRSKVSGVGCSGDDECHAQFNGSARAFCDSTKSPPTCELHPQACDTAAGCCPAQVCNAQGHYCFDKYTPCTQDGSCPAQGQVCKEIGIFAKGLGCTYNKCDPAGACGAGTSCFNKSCVGAPPCNGGCNNAANPVCITATNLCSPPPKDPSCHQTCPTGKMLVLQ